MGRVKIPYYVVKRNGRGFWQPTPEMRAHGALPLPCGPDGPEAWRVARDAYEAGAPAKSRLKSPGGLPPERWPPPSRSTGPHPNGPPRQLGRARNGSDAGR
jgi:hypothetical protein